MYFCLTQKMLELFVSVYLLSMLNTVDYHQSLNLQYLFCLIGSILPTCDCTLSRNIWVVAPDMEEYVRGESRSMLHVEHGSVLIFLSQGTT